MLLRKQHGPYSTIKFKYTEGVEVFNFDKHNFKEVFYNVVVLWSAKNILLCWRKKKTRLCYLNEK